MDQSLVCSSEYEKLPLENAFEESPQISAMVKVFSDDAKALHEYVDTLHQISSQLVSTHNKLTGTYQELAKHLKKYSLLENQLNGTDPTGILSSSLSKFSNIVSEMSSCEHILATQIADGVVYPLSKFIDSDLQEINTLESLYQGSSLEIERTIGRYSRIRKKDPKPERDDAIGGVFKARKNYHQLALQYYSRLNQLQIGRQIALLQPILGFITANRSHHQLGHETLSCKTSDDFLSGIGITLKGFSDDMRKDKVETEDLINSIITQSQLMYYPEPPGELAHLPPDTTLSSKTGYLNIHRKYMGVMSSWERQFVFIEGGNLMAVPKGEIAGTLLLELDASALAHASDTDDRLHVFIVASAKKSVILQALNDRERDEWMLTIQKVAKEGGYVKTDKIVQPSSLLSEFGQFFADKFQAASAAVGNTPSTPPAAVSPSSPSKTSPITSSKNLRGDVIPKNAPIMFDLLSSEEENASKDEESEASDESLKDENTFSVRFLGCMTVKVDTGQSVVFEVMRRILAARAIHNMFSTSHLHLGVTSSILCLRDPCSKSVRLQHKLPDVAYWAAHSENQRLFGYIARQSENASSANPKDELYSCYVFESDDNGKDICLALGAAARTTYAHLLDKKTKQEKQKEEMKILLDNIANLPSKDEPPQLSSDGNYLVLECEPEVHPPPVATAKKPDSDA